MSGAIRRRRLWKRILVTIGVMGAVVATAGSLAASFQVREIQVTGTRRFPTAQIETILQQAVGTPTVVVRADELRAEIRRIPWVADASVRVSLDGVVTCVVSERDAVAVAVDGADPVLLDPMGRILGRIEETAGWLELTGFLGRNDELVLLLGRRDQMEASWGAPLVRAERLGQRNVRLYFADFATILADPARPESLADGRRVLAAWLAEGRPAPLSLDVRAPGKVAVRPQRAEEGK